MMLEATQRNTAEHRMISAGLTDPEPKLMTVNG